MSLQAIISCLRGNFTSELDVNATKEESLAAEIVDKIYSSEKHGTELENELRSIFYANGASEELAEAVLNALAAAIQAGRVMNEAMNIAYGTAVEKASEIEEFVKEHPLFCSLIALGIVVLLMPGLLTALGFDEMGIIEGSLAARWQATFAGYVPKSSLFSYLQSLGTKLHWYY
ncbi:hypothetical protein BT63DRAFT_413851 [Microthyrium microscopicum]|uniref:Uncharacterized protein n=1 Tax=Microthyrium microscopicum TaxID=703497 RepID=A0A6A6UD90_9PEZI|nr:hypothetical protein BT63DRAFT_413851 [Microthyrium microscopicum]